MVEHLAINTMNGQPLTVAQTRRHTKVKTLYPPDSLRSLGGYNETGITGKENSKLLKLRMIRQTVEQ